ncbi:unnamed protein product [Malus baccata var. baccata]
MERSMRLVSAAFILVMFFAATEMGPMSVEARTESSKAIEGKICEEQKLLKVEPVNLKTNRFNGTCVSKSNFAVVSQTKGFTGGRSWV